MLEILSNVVYFVNVALQNSSRQLTHGIFPICVLCAHPQPKRRRQDILDVTLRGTYLACALQDLCQEQVYKVEMEPFKANCGQNADLSRMKA